MFNHLVTITVHTERNTWLAQLTVLVEISALTRDHPVGEGVLRASWGAVDDAFNSTVESRRDYHHSFLSSCVVGAVRRTNLPIREGRYMKIVTKNR
jgi:hypothetical protein